MYFIVLDTDAEENVMWNALLALDAASLSGRMS